MQGMYRCPLCDDFVNHMGAVEGTFQGFDCPTCGQFLMSPFFNFSLPDVSEEKRLLLSCYSRQVFDFEGQRLKITGDVLRDPEGSLGIKSWPVHEKIDQVIRLVASRSKYLGHTVQVFFRDWARVWAHGKQELDAIVNHLISVGFLEPFASTSPDAGLLVALTARGWEAARNLLSTGAQSSQAFVAMWFGATMEEAWSEGFRPALQECNYKPLRVDKKQHNNKSCDEVVAEIRKSGLVVADFTKQRQSVYFEAGLALGLGIPVIWTCHQVDVKTLHFDTRQFNHVVWKEPSELREKLRQRVEATVPRGVGIRPSLGR